MFSVGKMKFAGLMIGVMPAIASAHSHVSVDVGIDVPPPCVETCPAPVVIQSAPVERIWVEPVYRTTCDRVWRDAVTEDRCTRVWVPDVYRDEYVCNGRHTYVQHVLIAPGHYENRRETVVVQAGHWEDVQRQELVTPGHWETRAIEYRRVVEVAPERHHDFAGFFGRFRF